MVLYCVRSRLLANRVHSVEGDDTRALRQVVAKAATDRYERDRIMLVTGLNMKAHTCPAHYMCVPFPLQSAPKALCRRPRAQAQRLNCSSIRSGRYTCPAKGVCGLVWTLLSYRPRWGRRDMLHRPRLWAVRMHWTGKDRLASDTGRSISCRNKLQVCCTLRRIPCS